MGTLESVLTSDVAGFAFLLVVKATALLAAGLLAASLLRRASASARHFVLLLTLASLVVLPLLSFALPAWQLPWLPAAEAQAVRAVGPFSQPAAFDAESLTAASAEPLAAGQLQTALLEREWGLPVAAVERLRKIPAAGWMLGLWLAGVLLFGSRIVLGLRRVARLVRSADTEVDPAVSDTARRVAARLGIGVRPAVAYSDRLRVPIVWGWGRPRLILPSAARRWSVQRLRLVFLHELAHFRRRDGWTLPLIRAVVSLYWFHPLAWWTERYSRSLCERACDDVVVSGGCKPSDYASHLLGIAAGRSEPLSTFTPAFSGRTRMEKRLTALLHPHVRHGSISAGQALSVAVLFALILAPLAAAQLVAAPQQQRARVQKQEKSYDKKERPYARREPQDGEEWFGRGWELHGDERFEEAIEAFQRSAEAGHRVGTSYYNVACGYSMLDDRDAAIAWLERALEAGFDSPKHFWNDSDLDPLRTDPRFAALLERVGRELGHTPERDRLSEALETYDALAAERSTDGKAWGRAGLDLLRLRQFEAAADALTRAVQLRGDYATTEMYNLACVSSLQRDTPTALAWLDRAVESGLDSRDKMLQDPDLAAVRGSGAFQQIVHKADDLSLSQFHGWDDGAKLTNEETWRPAVAHFSDYVRQNPASGRAWFNLGFAYHSLGDYGGARQAFEEAYRIGYRRGTSLYNLACGASLRGEVEEAFRLLAEAEAAGFRLGSYLKEDSDLDNLRSDARFEQIAERYQREERERKMERKMRKRKEKSDR